VTIQDDFKELILAPIVVEYYKNNNKKLDEMCSKFKKMYSGKYANEEIEQICNSFCDIIKRG